MSIQLGGGGWHRSRNKDRYSDRYRASDVRWCKIMSVACFATILLSACTKRVASSIGRPSQRGIGHGWESVTRASTSDPDGGLLEVSRGELIWGLTAHWR
ncbi:hypothetical protein TIFTF001_039668 [Ficus carica]|uniref:Uncharacterized protein n=1 Tax=Ficus carica TaxID=3494 RepID=A0AA88JFH3_FICCA|nr:hypothetical protein TIFTF001_039668 [Ficus carica]